MSVASSPVAKEALISYWNKCSGYAVIVTAQPQPQPKSTSTRVGVDKVISWTTHPPTPHHTTPHLNF